MGLPFRRQPLGNHIGARELTHKQVARALGCSVPRVNVLISGRSYPTAHEIDALESLIGLPVQTMFEPALLKYFNVNGSRFSRSGRDARTAEQ